MNELIVNLIEQGGYWGIFALMVIENVFPPIPSELIMGMGGVAVARGTMSFWPLLLVGTVGSTLGNYVWFLAGHKLGYQRLEPLVTRWGRWLTLEWEDVENATAFFRRHGQWIVFALRFSPLLRTIISLPAGLTHMSQWRFLRVHLRRGGGVERAADRRRKWLGALPRRNQRGGDGLADRRNHRRRSSGLRLARDYLEAARLASWMGAAIDVQQHGGIDLGVDLRRAEAGMAEQFLQAAQVRTRAQQVGGEAEWRSACGVAVAGRPSAVRARAIAFCTMPCDRGPPLAPRNSGLSCPGGQGHLAYVILHPGADDAGGAARRAACRPCR
jgi:membrane protein YqaA with SNARE-associated domain